MIIVAMIMSNSTKLILLFIFAAALVQDSTTVSCNVRDNKPENDNRSSDNLPGYTARKIIGGTEYTWENKKTGISLVFSDFIDDEEVDFLELCCDSEVMDIQLYEAPNMNWDTVASMGEKVKNGDLCEEILNNEPDSAQPVMI